MVGLGMMYSGAHTEPCVIGRSGVSDLFRRPGWGRGNADIVSFAGVTS